MKRYPAFDPPEYVNWSPDPEVMAEFQARIVSDEARRGLIEALEPEEHLRLYRGLVRNRLFDVMLKRWVRQGLISKAWLGTGEEAVTVGAVRALGPEDVVGPMIRNSGAYLERGLGVSDLLRAYLGTEDSPGKGRDIHVGDLGRGVLAPISMVGSLVPVAAGTALYFKNRRQSRVALTWAGDGTTRTTAFHEGLMCASGLGLPLVVVVQDNQIALGTPHTTHSRAPIEDVVSIYGISSCACDGNHVLDVYAAVRLAAARCRDGQGPVIVTAKTLRMGGHATHDEGDSREILPPELFDVWGKKDPIGTYETYLAEGDMKLSENEPNCRVLEQAEADVREEVDRAAREALESRKARMPQATSLPLGVFSSDVER